MIDQKRLSGNLSAIHDRINAAELKAGRAMGSVDLLCVSKTVSTEHLRAAYSCGETKFGENRVQEILIKQDELDDLSLEWHLIGQLQTNKVRQIIQRVSLIHSLDRLSLAEEIERQAQKQGTGKIRCLVEVNVALEATKAGINIDQTEMFIASMHQFPSLSIAGLMTVAPPSSDPEEIRPFFRELSTIYSRIQSYNWSWAPFEVLSMGMSNDFEVAIEEGSNLVRLGTAIFGNR